MHTGPWWPPPLCWTYQTAEVLAQIGWETAGERLAPGVPVGGTCSRRKPTLRSMARLGAAGGEQALTLSGRWHGESSRKPAGGTAGGGISRYVTGAAAGFKAALARKPSGCFRGACAVCGGAGRNGGTPGAGSSRAQVLAVLGAGAIGGTGGVSGQARALPGNTTHTVSCHPSRPPTPAAPPPARNHARTLASVLLGNSNADSS
jgi:hypothetical protein